MVIGREQYLKLRLDVALAGVVDVDSTGGCENPIGTDGDHDIPVEEITTREGEGIRVRPEVK